MDQLKLHLKYLRHIDAGFRRSWTQRQDECGPRIYAIEQFRHKAHGRQEYVRAAHARAARVILGALDDLPNYDFLVTPAVAHWIRFAQSSRRITAFYRAASLNLHRLVSELGPFTWYGGMKDAPIVEAGIRRARKAPDLWDLVRFRVVCDQVTQLQYTVKQLLRFFGRRLVRCRNYYLDPRSGADDPYRAFHLELQYDAEEFVEIQLLTTNRESVGQIDHSLVRKKSIWPINSRHARWIRELSWCANIMDAQSLSAF